MSASGAPVVHVVIAGEIGGAERMLVDLATGTKHRPHSIALFTPNPRLGALFADANIPLDDRGPVVEGPLPYLARTLGSSDVRWLEGVLERRRAGIVHLHTFASQVAGTRAGLRVNAKVVRTEHSTRVYDDPSCRPFSLWSLRRVHASVCISEHVRRVALARAPWAEPIMSVIPNGVDVDRFAPRPRAGKSDRLRLVMLGRLEPRKGIDIALRAVKDVADVELEIVGDGPCRAALEKLARELSLGERVRFTGYEADVREAIARSDAALSSARSEGLGIALLEAMAMERPVVALPTGGIPEIVRDGEGFLAHGSDEAALERLLREVAERREELPARGARARETVLSSFSIDAMREAYERRYSTVLS